MDKQRVIDLFCVIDWMMGLQEELEQMLWFEIETIEESNKMQYVTSVERMAIARGLEKGMAQGLEQGIEKGREVGMLEGERKTLRRLLMRRFQVIPDWAEDRILLGADAELEQWLDNMLDATTVESVFGEQSSS